MYVHRNILSNPCVTYDRIICFFWGKSLGMDCIGYLLNKFFFLVSYFSSLIVDDQYAKYRSTDFFKTVQECGFLFLNCSMPLLEKDYFGFSYVRSVYSKDLENLCSL